MTKPYYYTIYFLLFISAILLPAMLKAQDSINALKPHQFKLNANTLGFDVTYEARLAKKLTLVPSAGIAFGGSAAIGRYSLSQAFKVINPELGIELRYYYNFKQREEKKKKTGNNSANFFSFSVVRGFKPFTSAELTETSEVYVNGMRQPDIELPIDPYASWSVSPNWGIQRQLGKCFNLELILGAGADYLSDDKKWRFAPNANFRIGYIIR